MKFDMDFNEIKPVAEEAIDNSDTNISDASYTDLAMEYAQLDFEITQVYKEYQKFALEAYNNANGDEDAYKSELAIVSESFSDKIKEYAKKAWDGLIKIIDAIISAMKKVSDRIKKWLKSFKPSNSEKAAKDKITIDGLKFDGWNNLDDQLVIDVFNKTTGIFKVIRDDSFNLIERPTATMFNESKIDFYSKKLDNILDDANGKGRVIADKNPIAIRVFCESLDNDIQKFYKFLSDVKSDLTKLKNSSDKYNFSSRDQVKHTEDGDVYADNIMDAFKWFKDSVGKVTRIFDMLEKDCRKLTGRLLQYAYV